MPAEWKLSVAAESDGFESALVEKANPSVADASAALNVSPVWERQSPQMNVNDRWLLFRYVPDAIGVKVALDEYTGGAL